MAYNVINEIVKVFDAENVNYQTYDEGGISCVAAICEGKNAREIVVHFTVTNDEEAVYVLSLGFATVPDDKVPSVLATLSKLNNQYRYVRFILDDSNDVAVNYDIPLSTADVGEVACELLYRMAQTIDAAYPELMEAIEG